MKFSVVTVCKNEVDKIAKTIESVVSQSYSDIEFIVIDGNSTDGTTEIIRNYSGIILISEPDDGIFYAMNKSLDIVNGDYVIFLNAGDFFVDKEVLTKVANFADGSDLIFGDVIFQYKSGILMRRKYPENMSLGYFFCDSINHQATFTKKELFNKIGIFDTNLKITADYEFSLKAIIKNKCTIQYLKFPISIFNLQGLSNNGLQEDLHLIERSICHQRYFDPRKIKFMLRFKIIYDLYFKKMRYIYFLVRSLISKRYLYD